MPATQDSTLQTELREREGFLHYLAREGRTGLRWTILGCIIAIVVCMVSPGFYFVAVVPAVVLLFAYVLLQFAGVVERRSDVVAHNILERSETAMVADVTDDHAEDHQLAPEHSHLVKRESKIAVGIIIAVMLTAVLIASIVLDFKVVAIGAFVVFAYMLLIAAPLWLGWIEDDIEDTSANLNAGGDTTPN